MALLSLSSLTLGLVALAFVAKRAEPAPRLEGLCGLLIIFGLCILGAALPIFR